MRTGALHTRKEISRRSPCRALRLGFDLLVLNFDTKPGDDFFRYANGAWFAPRRPRAGGGTNGVDTQLADIAEVCASMTS